MTLFLNPDQNPIPIPSASVNQEGVVYADQVTADNNVFIYADATNGDDANPGTQALPVQTLMAAFALVPPTWRKVCQIRLAAGTYVWNNWPPSAYNGDGMYLGNTIGPDGIGLFLVGEFTNVLGDLTASGASLGNTFTDNTLTVVADAYRGMFISCISGANAGQRRMVTFNTVGGQFTVNSPFANAVSPGDVYRIEDPAVVVDTSSFFVPIASEFNCVGIKFVNNAGFFAMPRSVIDCEACVFDLAGGFMEINGQLLGLSFSIAGGAYNPYNPFSDSRSQAGIYIKNGFMQLQTNSRLDYYFIIDNVLMVDGAVDSYMNLTNPSILNSQINTRGVVLAVGGETNGAVAIRGTVDGPAPFGGSSIVGLRGANLDLTGIDITNSADNAIDLTENSYGRIRDVGGSGNAGAGIHVGSMSKVVFDDGGTATSVTGTGGDTLVGTTPQTYVALANPANITDGYNNWISPASNP